MNFIRNLLALIGLLAVVGAGFAAPKALQAWSVFNELDPKAAEVYLGMYERLAATGSSAEAMVYKKKVEDGQTFEDVAETIRFVANEHNFKKVGESPLYKQVEAETGKPFRKTLIFHFCNAQTAAKMMAVSDAYAAWMPCRIALVEKDDGELWMYMMDMDPMIHGGKPLPKDLFEEATHVQAIMIDMLDRAAVGDF